MRPGATTGVAYAERSRARARARLRGRGDGCSARAFDDLVRITEKLEVHRVLQHVVAKPIEAEALERIDPRLRHHHALPDRRLRPVLADRVLVPRRDAPAARVLVGLDVDRDPVDVV